MFSQNRANSDGRDSDKVSHRCPMNKPAKISIVTPSLNQGRFLEETIVSVVSQDYPQLEYAIVDGGSTDDSVDIIRRYEGKLSYWVSEKDNGQSEAINKGLVRISGDIWGFLCSDDTYEPGTFSRVNAAFGESGADVVYGNCNFINGEGVITRRKSPGPFNRQKLLRGNYIYQPSVFLRKWILEEFGFFDDRLRYAMDYEYWVRISSRAKFWFLNETLSNYRLHPNSKSMHSIHGMNEESREIKHRYGVGLPADIQYLRFKYIGGTLYRLRRRLFDFLAK
jgi:glycosyltransferase involved in cell wall biosynthesis